MLRLGRKGGSMLNLSCGRDLVSIGIRSKEGSWNITAFLDHLGSCNVCGQSEETLIGLLNDLIGGEEEED
jgi:hypothetical protein